MAAEVEDLLHAARREGRDVQGAEQLLGRARNRRGDAAGVIAAQRQHAAAAIGADVVAVADRVGRAIEPGGLAEPHADDAVEARAGERAGELRAVHGGRGELLVDRAAQHDVVLGGERAQPLELAVEAGQRRAGVAGGERRGAQPGGRVGAVLVDQHPHAGLHAGEEDLALLEDVAVLE